MHKLLLCSAFSVLAVCILNSCTPKSHASANHRLTQEKTIKGKTVGYNAFTAKDKKNIVQSDQYRKLISTDLVGGDLGGFIGKRMQPVDRAIMRSAIVRAEDKHWQNNSTGMSFTLIPSKYKKYYRSGSICRLFSIAVVDNKGDNNKMHSRACLNSDGQWRIVRAR